MTNKKYDTYSVYASDNLDNYYNGHGPKITDKAVSISDAGAFCITLTNGDVIFLPINTYLDFTLNKEDNQ